MVGGVKGLREEIGAKKDNGEEKRYGRSREKFRIRLKGKGAHKKQTVGQREGDKAGENEVEESESPARKREGGKLMVKGGA